MLVLFWQHWLALVVGAFLFLAWSALSLPATFAVVASSLDKRQHTMGIGVQSMVRRVPVMVGPLVGGWLTPSAFDLRQSSVYIFTMREHEPLKFSYRVPRGPEGEVVKLTVAEMERRLLERLEAATENPTQAMRALVQFYKQDNRDRKSVV